MGQILVERDQPGTRLRLFGGSSLLLILLALSWSNLSSLTATVPSTPALVAQRRVIGIQNKPSSKALEIVNRAYSQTFSTFQTCTNTTDMIACLQQKQRLKNTHWPWWFQTMLRDAVPQTKQNDFLYGQWHELYIEDPPLKLCVIEKVATKQWRQVQCKLNDPNQTHVAGGASCQPTTKPKTVPPQVVFLRDPLERFLSGFLDKCASRWKWDQHCEPRELYESDELTVGLTDANPQTFFEAFVESMPLRWNLYFYPQSLYCDGLYRHVQNYEFVGNMGGGFYNDLTTMAYKYGRRAGPVLEDVFEIEKHQAETTINVGVETSAASRVLEYYNPRTVRRVLEYVSIDYVLLGLPIPAWVDKMLEDETG